MYESEKWKATRVKGLQHRQNRIFLYRRRVKGKIYQIYLGKLPVYDAEFIAGLLHSTPPENWKTSVKRAIEFCAWEDTYQPFAN